MKQSKLVSFFDKIVQPRYQIISIIFSSIMAIIIAHFSLYTFRDVEPRPALVEITPKKIEKWGRKPYDVTVGFYIKNFSQFDLMADSFKLTGIIWFEFDPKKVSLEEIEHFSIEKGELTYKSQPHTRTIGDKLFVEYKVVIDFTSILTYKFFPLDDHRIYISLINVHLDPRKTAFIVRQGDFVIATTVETVGWKIVNHNVETGYAKAELSKDDATKIVRYPKAIFSIDLRRFGLRYILLILLPLFLIFFVGLFALSFDPATHEFPIRSLASASIASMIGYRFVIQGMSPNTGYFTLSDHIFTLFLLFAFIEFLLAIFLSQQGKLTRYLIIIRGLVFIMFHVGFIATWFYLLFIWG